MRYFAAALLLVTLFSCGPTIEMQAPFDRQEVAFIKRQGSATVSGQAFMRQAGGGVVTCAGSEVGLVPAGRYAQEFITRSFGKVQGGHIPAIMTPRITHPPAFGEYRRKAICDAEGDFEFQRVAPGRYYLTSIVLWQVPNQLIPEGGAMARLIDVGRANRRVILSP